MRDRLLARDLTVETAERRREADARGRERLKAERGQQARGADIPRIWQQQRHAGPVE